MMRVEVGLVAGAEAGSVSGLGAGDSTTRDLSRLIDSLGAREARWISRMTRPSAHVLLAVIVAGPMLAATQPSNPVAQASVPAELRTLVPGHPRLIVDAAAMSKVQEQVAADARLREWRNRLRQDAAAILEKPPVERRLVGPRLLAQSREALRRISLLAGLYRIDGDIRWRDRAILELRAVAAFEDWNPSHFLDVAEMAAAVAIGYDWLYAELYPEDRVQLRSALVTKALQPGLAALDGRVWWASEGRNNWTQVCFGGLTLAALAVADEEPARAARVLAALRGEGLTRRLQLYAPDGGDEEGPSYWDYATTYTALMLSSLESALGTDFGLGQAEGLSNTGAFRVQAVGPSGRQFNYGDARERPGDAPQMFWLAGRYGRPEYAVHERAWLQRADATPSIFHLLWAPRVPAEDPAAPPVSAQFRGVEVAFLRGDWRDRSTSWVALKGGRNAASHAHLDLGSFVLDSLGERWAVDLGPDDYDLPEYFGPRRWSYFRLRTESHNTLLVNGGNQATSARAPIVAFSDDSYRAFAVVDLSEAYAPALASARRGVALVDGRDVLVQDEIAGAANADVVWQMLTRANVSLAGSHAVLRQNGRTLTLRVLEPEDALLRAGPAGAPAPEAQQPDVTTLRVMLPTRRESARIVVWLSSADRPPPPTTPLDVW